MATKNIKSLMYLKNTFTLITLHSTSIKRQF